MRTQQRLSPQQYIFQMNLTKKKTLIRFVTIDSRASNKPPPWDHLLGSKTNRGSMFLPVNGRVELSKTCISAVAYMCQ